MKCLITLTILVMVFHIINAENYCDPYLCSYGVKHIGCHNPKYPSANCPDNTALLKLTPSIKNLIVRLHNEKRNYIASGIHPKFDPACNMATMQWSDDLATLAEYNVLQCEMEHDQCHNTHKFQMSGQNLASMWYMGKLNLREKIAYSFNMWYNEIKYAKMQHMIMFPATGSDTIGHFATMITEKNTHVGCAALIYKRPNRNFAEFLLACNYATTPVVNYPIYKDCVKSGEGCISGKNNQYRNLCTVNEKFNLMMPYAIFLK